MSVLEIKQPAESKVYPPAALPRAQFAFCLSILQLCSQILVCEHSVASTDRFHLQLAALLLFKSSAVHDTFKLCCLGFERNLSPLRLLTWQIHGVLSASSSLCTLAIHSSIMQMSRMMPCPCHHAFPVAGRLAGTKSACCRLD